MPHQVTIFSIRRFPRPAKIHPIRPIRVPFSYTSNQSMKNIITILLLTFSIQIGLSQACGTYRINYVGKVINNTAEIQSIKLPTVRFLHGFDEPAFVEIDFDNGKIDKELFSPLTSALYDDPNRYLELYRNKRDSLPVVFGVKKNDKEQEITIEIPWENIELKRIEDEEFGYLFQLNLKEIKIE